MNHYKKTIILLIISIFLAGSATAQYTLQNRDVVVNSDGVLTTFSNTTQKNIVIPAMLDGQTITSIGLHTFYNKALTSVDFSGLTGLTSIESWAFRDNFLTSVDLSQLTSLTSIGEGAFWFNSLTSVDLSQLTSLTSIGSYAFNNNALTSFTLPPSTVGYTMPSWDVSGSSTPLTAGGSATDVTKSYTLNPNNSGLITYTITYVLNSGTNAAANPANYTAASTITLAAPTRGGYTFLGWYTEATFISLVAEITAGSTGVRTFYAKWEAEAYAISYELDGGTNAGNPTSYTIESTTIPLATPIREGYTFSGWYTESAFTNAVTEITTGSTGDKTFYARWTVTVTVTNESFVTTYDQGGTLTASITINDVSSVQKVNFVSRGISEKLEDATTVEISPTGNVYEVTLKSTDLIDPIGLIYYFEAIDKADPPSTITSTIGNAYLNFTTGTTESIPSLSFGDQVVNYQIIAIPLDLDDKKVTSVFSELGSYDKTLWRLFDYANQNNREYSGFSNVDIGKGYWFIARNSATISTGSGSTPQVTETNPFSMSLASGWNLIGNPYNFRISWDEVLTANGSPSSIGRINTFSGGTLAERSTLDKYRGGFVFNSGSATSINIPVTRNTSLGGRHEAEEKPTDLGEQYWELSLKLSQGSLENQLGGIGMHPDATMLGKDEFDQVSVPLIAGMGFFELGFAHPEFNVKFSKEMVSSIGQYTWEMIINRDIEQSILLTWDNARFGANNNQLYLFNPSTLEVIDMRDSNQIEIGSTTTKLKVLFGSQNYINEQLEKEIPQLGEPYPNPTTHQISYPFKISKGNQQSATLKVFDNTGKLVGEKSDSYQAGFYQLDWEFDRQGMYIIQLQIGEVIKRNKIIVR